MLQIKSKVQIAVYSKFYYVLLASMFRLNVKFLLHFICEERSLNAKMSMTSCTQRRIVYMTYILIAMSL